LILLNDVNDLSDDLIMVGSKHGIILEQYDDDLIVFIQAKTEIMRILIDEE